MLSGGRPTRRRAAGRWTAVLAALALLLGVAPAGADTPDPYPWPSGAPAPGIDATAHSLRIAGPDRYQTSLAGALLLRGQGGYPFTTPDRTSGDVDQLAAADQWWGLGTCPYSVIVTAGDTAADSLAAASLSDPTDGSSEPTLVRSAAADPTFDPIGATGRVDTDSAPILVTTSARDGATALSPAARTAAADLTDGGCRTATSAIIVGGPAAVPAGVDQQLVDLGYDQVFRVAGQTRFGTAAAIARALGTGDPVNGVPCDDPDVTDGDAAIGFHGNAAVEYRTSPTSCEVLGRTVVLTDGITGADALAAGWWTSLWQVPVLLVDGDGELPSATRDALNALVIDNVVVLGGHGRIPAGTVSEVESLTGARAVRVAGPNRYATSVEMAQTFGGWFPTGVGADHDGSILCLAASSGSGNRSVGWPDALGAGPWCAEASGAAAAVPAPVRGLPPVSGTAPRLSRGLAPSHGAVPVLLTPASSDTLPDSVAQLLAGTFDPADTWCSSIQPDDNCLDPGFVVTFGGPAVVPEAAVRAAAQAVSGQTYVVFSDQSPSAEPGFWTTLDLRPVYAMGGAAEDVTAGRACVDRGDLRGVRWLATYRDVGGTRFGTSHDLLTQGRYVTDADGVARTPGTNVPSCVRVADISSGVVAAVGTSISGNNDPFGVFSVGEEHRLTLSGSIVQEGAQSLEGTDTTLDDTTASNGTSSRLVFTQAPSKAVAVTSQTVPAGLAGAGIDLTIARGTTASDPDDFFASLSLGTSLGSVVAVASGEASYTGKVWELRGRVLYKSDGTWNVQAGAGGFRATLDPNQTDYTDDVLEWQIDGLVSASS